MQRNVIYYGQEAELPQPLALRAGPLELVYQAGDLRHIRLHGRDIVRRIYFAARDADWGTAPNTIERQSVETASRGFRVLLIAHSRMGDMGLYWQADIKGAADGTISYQVNARAERTFLSNRVGLCLLHPAPECAGARCRVTHSDGSVEEGRLPERIAPHQPFGDICAFSYELSDGVWVTATLAGDTFEMEDQRNWTDASWKTYSRPLALPRPVEIVAGQRIVQSVTIQLETEQREIFAVPATRPAPPELEVRAEARVSASEGAVLPPIGLAEGDAPAQGSTDGPDAVARLQALQLAHLRVALAPDTPAVELARWAGEARALSLPLELALLDGGAETAAQAAAWLVAERLPVAKVLVCTRAGDGDAAAQVRSTRAALARACGDAPVFVGTDGYFTNLNRERPCGVGADGVFYSLNPQVHAVDNDSLIETLPTQAETVRSAQALYPGLAVAVTPVTLRPRRSAEADPRQASLFAAGWALGSVATLAAAGVASVTYFETNGARGVMGGGELYPVYHLLSWLAGWRGAMLCPVAVSDPARPGPVRLQALALRRGNTQRLILANVCGKPMTVALSGLGEGAMVQTLDERNDAAARCGELGPAQPLAGGTLTLPPFGLACVDAMTALE